MNGSRRDGWTLLELLVVVAILGVLAALSLAAVVRVRAAADRVRCANNLRQIGIALLGYHDAARSFPPGLRYAPDPFPFLAWSARVAPHLEQDAVWSRAVADYAANPDFGASTPHAGLGTVLSVYLCPADGRRDALIQPENYRVAFTFYLGIEGGLAGRSDGILYANSRVRLADVTDGASTTAMVGERPPSPDETGDMRFGWWYAGVGQLNLGSADYLLHARERNHNFRTPTCPRGPYDFSPGNPEDPCSMFHFWSRHPGGGHFLFADGSARLLAYSAAPILFALATRAGGETAAIPD